MHFSASNKSAAFLILAVLSSANTISHAQQLRLPSALTRTSPPRCAIAPVARAVMVTLDDIALPVTNRSIVHLRAVESGKLIRLVGASNDRNIYRVTVRSKFAEETGDSSHVCGPISWSPAIGPLTAYDDRLPPRSVWEIELLASPSAKGKRIEIQSEGA